MKIVNFSVSKRITITMMTLIVIVGGFISFSKLGLDMLPDVEFPMVSVITTYVGASPEDIESTVTKTVEQTVASVSGVKSVQSTSMESVSMVMVELGVENNDDIIVLSGITEGQSIVTEGAFLLIDGSPVKDSE